MIKSLQTRYLVLKDSFLPDGKFYKSPMWGVQGGKVLPIKYNVVTNLVWEDLRLLYYAGIVTDDLPRYINGEICHPETRRTRY